MLAIALMYGYKSEGEASHKRLIEYMIIKYKEFTTNEIRIIDDLREKRNRVYYDGISLPEDYLDMRWEEINSIIKKLNLILKNKIKENGHS